MKTTNANRRIALIMSAMITATAVIPTAGVAADSNEADTTVVTTKANGSPISTNPHSFKVGSKGYSFKAYIEPTEEGAEPQETDDPTLSDYIVLSRCDEPVKDFDIDEAFRYEIFESDTWSYGNFVYDNVNSMDITNDFTNTIMKACVHLVTLTEDDIPKYDIYPDGVLNVADVVIANQIRVSNPLLYLGGEVETYYLFLMQAVPLASKNEYVKVSINENGNIETEAYGDINTDIPKDSNGDYISDEVFAKLVGGCQYYGIDNYRLVYSEEPVMYAFGIDTRYDGYITSQILPKEYYWKLMNEEEYNVCKDDTEEYEYVLMSYVFMAAGRMYNKLISTEAISKTWWPEPILENFYLIPVDENGNDILQCAGGSKLLMDKIAESNLLDPPTFDENGNEIISSTIEPMTNSEIAINAADNSAAETNVTNATEQIISTKVLNDSFGPIVKIVKTIEVVFSNVFNVLK